MIYIDFAIEFLLNFSINAYVDCFPGVMSTVLHGNNVQVKHSFRRKCFFLNQFGERICSRLRFEYDRQKHAEYVVLKQKGLFFESFEVSEFDVDSPEFP